MKTLDLELMLSWVKPLGMLDGMNIFFTGNGLELRDQRAEYGGLNSGPPLPKLCPPRISECDLIWNKDLCRYNQNEVIWN